jgi:hypothetical protein
MASRLFRRGFCFRLTKAQAGSFGETWLAPLKDRSGRVIVPGRGEI